jgi:hypothetical protein
MPKAAEPWWLASLRTTLISHGRYVTFQTARGSVPRQMFHEILMLIARLRAPRAPSTKEFGVGRRGPR